MGNSIGIHISLQSDVFNGGAKYALLRASHIACDVSFSILEIVALPILNVKDCDC